MKLAKLLPSVELQSHQSDAVRRSGDVKGLALNWGLGSGKTLGAIAIAERKGGNVLVVTPASLRTNFASQLKKFVTKDRIKNYTIMSYDKFRRDPEGAVNRIRPNTVIADEFHRLRNTKPREPFERVRDRVPFMLGLTGSLINNRPEEIVPLVNLTSGKKVFKNPESFKNKYIKTEKIPTGFVGWLKGSKPGIIESVKNKQDLRKKLSPYVHRFTGTPEYRKHLPRVVEEKVEVIMTPQQEQMYKALSGRNPALAYKLKHNLPPSKSELKEMNSFMSASRQIMNNPSEYTKKESPDVITSSPKFRAQVADIQKRVKKDPNFRAVIYSSFLSSGIEPVVTELNAKGIRSEAFTGKLNDRQRSELVANLNKGRTRVLGLSPAGGEGLDLKGVRLVQLTEEHWNPERGAQAIGRSARFKSHAHLPAKDRVVNVKRYQAVHAPTLMNRIFGTKKSTSPDQWVDNRRLEKLRLNQGVLNAIEEYGDG